MLSNSPNLSSIGVFDSGYGGLTILRGLKKSLPDLDFVYLGDNARAPYGDKNHEVILKHTIQAIEFLFKRNCQLVVLACNTASSQALGIIQHEYLPKKHPDKKVLGVIIPACEVAIEKTVNSKIGVLGTTATVNSKTFEIELLKLNPEATVFQQACPKLVPLIENSDENVSSVLKHYLKPLLNKSIDTLVLGCTHYALIEEKIKKLIPKNIKVINEENIIGDKLSLYFKRHPEIAQNLGKNSTVTLFTTGNTKKFADFAEKLFHIQYSVEKAAFN